MSIYIRRFRDLPQYKPLTREEERELGLSIQESKKQIELYRARLKNTEDPQKRAEFLTELNKYEQQLSQSVDKLVSANIRFAAFEAKKYMKEKLEYPELVQLANYGLKRAALKFDPEEHPDVKFISYASWWIYQIIQRESPNLARTVDLPIHVLQRVNKVRRFKDKFYAAHGREPTEEEVSQGTGIKLDLIKKLSSYTLEEISLNQTYEGEDSDSDELEVYLITDPIDAAIRDIPPIETLFREAKLTKREEEVLRYRFGLYSKGEPLTFESIGKKYNRTRERIRQIETKALQKLRRVMKRKRLTLDDFI